MARKTNGDDLNAYSLIPLRDEGAGERRKMHGSRRVITFCLFIMVIPTILITVPLYLKYKQFSDVKYKIFDSDVIQIHKGQSSIFCEKHTLKMSSPFNAFQMNGRPLLSEERKHIQLKKSMTLPDDTLEYWGFYLFKGATVILKSCSTYRDAKVLLVRGERTLNTCHILDNRLDYVHFVTNEQHNIIVTLEEPNSKDNNENNGTVVTDFDKELLEARTLIAGDVNDKGKSGQRRQVKRDAQHIDLHNPNTILDTGVNHGGNAFNEVEEDRSTSSFENDLLFCYKDNILIHEKIPFSLQCNGTKYLETTTTLRVKYDVVEDGYYYFIFYSDNDLVKNDVQGIFDILKPVFQYSNMSQSKVCINQTKCEFAINFLSPESVIVEVPTADGIKSDDYEGSSVLISTCRPRAAIYIWFPIAVMILVLIFAFL